MLNMSFLVNLLLTGGGLQLCWKRGGGKGGRGAKTSRRKFSESLTFEYMAVTKGHVYLNKPAAVNCRFV